MYPEKTTVVLLYILSATIISAPVCMLAEKDLTSFLLKPGVPLASVMYTVRIQTLYDLLYFKFSKYNGLTALFLGRVSFIIGHGYTHMGSAYEGSSLHLLVQAVVYCYCGCSGCYFPRRCTSPWEVPLFFTFFLYSLGSME